MFCGNLNPILTLRDQDEHLKLSLHYKYRAKFLSKSIKNTQERKNSRQNFISKMAMNKSILLFFILTFSATLLVAKQDPELKQCKHQCGAQQQITGREIELCEERCEDYYQQKKEMERRRETGHNIWEDEENEEPRQKQLRECQRQCEKFEGQARQLCHYRCEKRFREQEEQGSMNPREQQGEEDQNPYVFEDRHFETKAETEHGRVKILQKFTERSELLRGIENFRFGYLVANPQTFIVPNHLDAEGVFFVVKGKGTFSMIRDNKRESYNIRRGDIVRIRAGTPVYLINRDENEKLVIAKFLSPVSTPGHVEAFFEAGGNNPETFYRAFSIELLEAALKTKRDQLERLFGQQRQGPIMKASKEQIESMSHHHEEGGMWPFGGETRGRGAFNLFSQRPIQSNDYGQLYEARPEDFKQLQHLDLAVSFANITQGSMLGPFFNSRATKIAFVQEGDGYFEMACPHLGSSRFSQGQTRGREGSQTGREYQKVRAQIRRNMVFVVPAGHPVAVVASRNQNLQVVCFEVNAQENEKYALAGARNIINQMEREAKELAFAMPGREVERIFRNNDIEELFFPGPGQEKGGRAYEM